MEGGMPVKDEPFNELAASVKEGGQTLRGKKKLYRLFFVTGWIPNGFVNNTISPSSHFHPCRGSV